MASPSERPRNILLLTSPRVCAHLFTRMLSDQPRFKHGPAVYFFSPGARIMHVSRDVTAATWTEEDRRVTAEERTASLEYMEKFVKETNDEGKAAFLNEQCYLTTDLPRVFDIYGKSADGKVESFQKGSNRSDINGTKSALRTNPLVIPDEYMRSFQTIFLIRDPRLVLFSLIKAHKDSWPEYRTKFAMFLNSNLQFVRDAHAWLASEAAEGNCPEPLIVDSEDVINNSETLQRLCDRTGLDKSRIRYEWEAMPEEVLSKLPIAGQRFLAEISRSTGVVPSRLRADLGSEKERASWRKELGEEDAEVLEGFVERAMPHYEHLYARRLQG